MTPSTPSPSKKHLSTQYKDEQDATERVWIRGVLERNPSLQDVDSTSNADVQIQLHSLLRNLGSRVRKSVTEGYSTPPTTLPAHINPCISPSKQATTNQGSTFPPLQRSSELQNRVFSSSKDILRSVYTQGHPPSFSPSPKKRSRTSNYDGLIGEDENTEDDDEDQIDIDLPDHDASIRASSTRIVKPLPFRLSRQARLTAGCDISSSSSHAAVTPVSEEVVGVAAVNEDPFSSPLGISRNPLDMETDMELLKGGVEVL